MVTNQHSIGRSNETGTPSSSELFAILEHRFRRTVLEYLSVHDPPISLAELVTVVAEDKTVPESNHRQLVIELHHNHLPRLSDYGLISYDFETNTVEQGFDDPTVEAVLNLVAGSSLRM